MRQRKGDRKEDHQHEDMTLVVQAPPGYQAIHLSLPADFRLLQVTLSRVLLDTASQRTPSTVSVFLLTFTPVLDSDLCRLSTWVSKSSDRYLSSSAH